MQNLPTYLTVYFCVIAGVFGACAGSFLSCMSWRIVHGEKVSSGRSHCDKCGHTLSFFDLVPVFGYLRHGGKCGYCGEKLSPMHLVGELVSAAVFVLLLLKFGISVDLIENLLFCSLLLAASFADIEGYIIPDRYILAGIAVKVVFNLFEDDILSAYIASVVGGLTVALPLFLIALASEKLLKKESMGGGDIKLLFVTGLYLGALQNVLCLIVACFAGIIIALISGKKTGEPFPWGPSISLAAFLCLLFGEAAVNAYTSLL